MLGNKAKPRRLNSKGNLYGNNSSISNSNSNTLLSLSPRSLHLDTVASRLGKALSNSIPVLSIFALMGIISYAIGINVLEDITNTGSESAYAVTIPDGTPSASLTISGNGTTEQISAGRGSTAYRTHTVNVKAGDISDYSIIISGPTNMTSPSGGSVITGTDGNKTGESLAANTWGYAWGDSASENANMTYKALSTGGTNLTSGDKPTISNNAINFTRKLVFAVKFDEDTTEGRYYAENVNLALTVSPKLIVVGVWTNPDNTTKDSGISTMQAMTYDICSDSSVKTGATMLLQDSRDDNIYSIGKLSDGKCWMTQNLAFDIAQATAMSAENSDVASSWSWPTTPARYTTGRGWSPNDTVVAYITTPTIDNGYPGDNTGLQNSYGYYYSWCAATAGCRDTSGNTLGVEKDAASSICPKGWKLPKSGTGTTNDFAKAIGLTATHITANVDYWSSLSDPTFTDRALLVNGSAWIAAGYVNPGNGLRYPGTGGFYWSRTASNATNAYDLYFYSSNVYPAGGDYRRYGLSVRCVVEEPQTIKTITTMQEMTPQICKASKIGDTTTLTDTRDNKTYAITKLEDGNCWMTQNLTLNLNGVTLTSATSDVMSNWVSTTGASTSWNKNTSIATNQAMYYERNVTTPINETGNFYNWCAATAGSCSSAIADGAQTTSSICPKGWTLPTGGSSGQWKGLFDVLGTSGGAIANYTKEPYNFNTSTNNIYTGTGWLEPEIFSEYWSKTAVSSSEAYVLNYSGYGISPSYTALRKDGDFVRCVAYSS